MHVYCEGVGLQLFCLSFYISFSFYSGLFLKTSLKVSFFLNSKRHKSICSWRNHTKKLWIEQKIFQTYKAGCKVVWRGRGEGAGGEQNIDICIKPRTKWLKIIYLLCFIFNSLLTHPERLILWFFFSRKHLAEFSEYIFPRKIEGPRKLKTIFR